MNAWKEVTAEELETEAIAAIGLNDFGHPSYREGLEVLLGDFKGTARFDERGAAFARGMLVGTLVQRLRTVQRMGQAGDRHPVEQPWVILSMPRSGTTALHRILCADPAAQGLEHWLGVHPQPRPARQNWQSNPDFETVEAALQASRIATPNVFAQHEMHADMVDECRLLFMQNFANMSYFATATAPNYAEWLWTCDMGPSYAWYNALLELIGNGSPRRWVLKDPSHLMSLDALIKQYPDLRVICTRRSAEDFLPSVSSLVYEARHMFEPETTRQEVAREALGTWSRAAHAITDWRAAHPKIPWVDIELSELRSDPIAVCKRLYSSFDAPFSEDTETAIRSALSEGVHAGATLEKQTLELYGLDRDEIKALYPAEFL